MKNNIFNELANDRSSKVNFKSTFAPLFVDTRLCSEVTNNTQCLTNNIDTMPSVTVKRNLFGIRLNHDQLKEDLEKLRKDQMERQKKQWNFDFETLRPTNIQGVSNVFEWKKVNTFFHAPHSTMMVSCVENVDFNSRTMHQYKNKQTKYNAKNFEEEYIESSEEEEDEALAIPQFYKYQRRLKLSEVKQQQRNKRKNVATTVVFSAAIDHTDQFEPIFKLNQPNGTKISRLVNNNLKKTLRKQNSTKLSTPNKADTKTRIKNQLNKQSIDVFINCTPKKQSSPIMSKIPNASITNNKSSFLKPSSNPQSVNKSTQFKGNKQNKKIVKRNKQTSLALSPSTQNLIITFSENRKDTLRSACINNSTAKTSKLSIIDATCNKSNISCLTSSTNVKSLLCSTSKIIAITSSSETERITQTPIKNNNINSMRQQSLLDLFKQRKRRNTSQPFDIKDVSNKNINTTNDDALVMSTRSKKKV